MGEIKPVREENRKKIWTSAKVRSRAGERSSVGLEFCGYFLLYRLHIWQLLMAADPSFSLNKHFYFPILDRVLVMIWESGERSTLHPGQRFAAFRCSSSAPPSSDPCVQFSLTLIAEYRQGALAWGLTFIFWVVSRRDLRNKPSSYCSYKNKIRVLLFVTVDRNVTKASHCL